MEQHSNFLFLIFKYLFCFTNFSTICKIEITEYAPDVRPSDKNHICKETGERKLPFREIAHFDKWHNEVCVGTRK